MLRYRVEQLLRLEPLLRKQPVSIPVRTITQQRNNSVALAELLRNLLGRDDIQTRTGTEVKSLVVQAAVHHLDRLLVADVQRAVKQVNVGLQVVRHAALSDALGNRPTLALSQLAAALDVRVQDRPRGVGEEALDAAVADVLEVAGYAGKRAAGTCCASESVDLATGLVPDLRASGLNVRLAVGGVVELVGPDGVVEALGVALGLVVVVLRVVEGDGGDGVDFSAEEPQQVNLALRLRVRHVDDEVVALGAAHMGKSDARVARCAFNDGATWTQQTGLLSVLDDKEGRAVLDAASGILEFGFPEDIAASLLGDLLETNQGCLADCWGSISAGRRRRGGGVAYRRESRGGRCPGLWRC
jgi:hypothetical protein